MTQLNLRRGMIFKRIFISLSLLTYCYCRGLLGRSFELLGYVENAAESFVRAIELVGQTPYRAFKVCLR